MAKNRRRIYFVDRLFQRRFIVLFLIVALLITVGNTVFYFGYLRPTVEDAMYHSHITIDNPSELVFQHAIRFTLIMAISIMLVVVVFYSILRIRLERFFLYLTERMENLMRGLGREETIHRNPGEEFQDFAPALLEFMHVVDLSYSRKQNILQALKMYCSNPDDVQKAKLLDELRA